MLYSKAMKKLWFNTHKEFKGKVALAELKRAHLIITLLSMSLAFIIIIMSLYPVQVDTLLAALASALLIIVAAISLSIALMIKVKK